jgi:hypothetical protein
MDLECLKINGCYMTEKSGSKFSPKSFLKSRRPERFSDSVIREVGRLDRSALEHQLSTHLKIFRSGFVKK